MIHIQTIPNSQCLSGL